MAQRKRLWKIVYRNRVRGLVEVCSPVSCLIGLPFPRTVVILLSVPLASGWQLCVVMLRIRTLPLVPWQKLVLAPRLSVFPLTSVPRYLGVMKHRRYGLPGSALVTAPTMRVTALRLMMLVA